MKLFCHPMTLFHLGTSSLILNRAAWEDKGPAINLNLFNCFPQVDLRTMYLNDVVVNLSIASLSSLGNNFCDFYRCICATLCISLIVCMPLNVCTFLFACVFRWKSAPCPLPKLYGTFDRGTYKFQFQMKLIRNNLTILF